MKWESINNTPKIHWKHFYADDTTLYFKCDQASDLWQQLELTAELESDQQGPVDWDRKRLVSFNAGKTQLVSCDQSNNTTGAIEVKMDGSVLVEKSCFNPNTPPPPSPHVGFS